MGLGGGGIESSDFVPQPNPLQSPAGVGTGGGGTRRMVLVGNAHPTCLTTEARRETVLQLVHTLCVGMVNGTLCVLTNLWLCVGLSNTRRNPTCAIYGIQ